jgi:hypothetical protein
MNHKKCPLAHNHDTIKFFNFRRLEKGIRYEPQSQKRVSQCDQGKLQKIIKKRKGLNFKGYSRKYAIRILNGRIDPGKKKPGPRKKYGPHVVTHLEMVTHLEILWRAMGKICSKKMVAAIPIWLKYYESPLISPDTRMQLLRVSASSIDRLLRPYRENKIRGISTTTASWVKSRIPIELMSAKAPRPGLIEADTVAHCGDSASGSFASSLTMTDLYSGWTENRAVWTKQALGVRAAIEEIEKCLPFMMEGFSCDNGTEFLNECLLGYFKEKRRYPIKFTRKRPYKKNDACHVEQKNYTHVRNLFGYARFDDPALIELMNLIYARLWNPLWNFFTPCCKLKEKKRIGAKIKKIYDEPQTPYERLLESDHLEIEQKQRLKEQMKSLNPFKLRKELDKKLQDFFRVVEINKKRWA